MINAVIRNSRYTSFFTESAWWWKCIETYIEHTFEQMDEIIVVLFGDATVTGQKYDST